jgi:predicted O-methyltransferase YrrM
MSIAKRAIPDASSIQEASQRVRGPWLSAIQNHHLKYSGDKCVIRDILDIGCSVGVSSRFLAEKFPAAGVVVSLFFMLIPTCFI